MVKLPLTISLALLTASGEHVAVAKLLEVGGRLEISEFRLS